MFAESFGKRIRTRKKIEHFLNCRIIRNLDLLTLKLQKGTIHVLFMCRPFLMLCCFYPMVS